MAEVPIKNNKSAFFIVTILHLLTFFLHQYHMIWFWEICLNWVSAVYIINQILSIDLKYVLCYVNHKMHNLPEWWIKGITGLGMFCTSVLWGQERGVVSFIINRSLLLSRQPAQFESFCCVPVPDWRWCCCVKKRWVNKKMDSVTLRQVQDRNLNQTSK